MIRQPRPVDLSAADISRDTAAGAGTSRSGPVGPDDASSRRGVSAGGPDPRLGRTACREASLRFPPDSKREELVFSLSMGLFSSGDIDTGTKLLLRRIHTWIDFSHISSMLDVGCGTGVLAVALKSAYPHLHAAAIDRDALALAWTAENARRNGAAVDIRQGLDLTALAPGFRDHPLPRKPQSFSPLAALPAFDLIVSNIPAKAGLPVLDRFFGNAAALLNPEGLFTFVIVAPLRETALRLARAHGFQFLHDEAGKGYTAALLSRGDSPAGEDRSPTPVAASVPAPTAATTENIPDTPDAADGAGDAENHLLPETAGSRKPDCSFPGSYLRYRHPKMMLRNLAFPLTTVYGLPDFDTPPHQAAAAVAINRKGRNVTAGRFANSGSSGDYPRSKYLFWNPGQGHLPAALLISDAEQGVFSPAAARCFLAGRDLLALLTTAGNLLALFPDMECRLVHCPGLEWLVPVPEAVQEQDLPVSSALRSAAELRGPFNGNLQETFDLICVDVDPIPGVPFSPGVEAAANLLNIPGGRLLICGTSSSVGAALKGTAELSSLDFRHMKGFRADLLRRRISS